MELEKIREQLIYELVNDIEHWSNTLNNTNPGNYGLDDWDVVVDENDFYVDIPNRAFNFKNVEFTANLILGASKGDLSFNYKYCEFAKGKGTFEFDGKDKVKIQDINIEIDLDLFK